MIDLPATIDPVDDLDDPRTKADPGGTLLVTPSGRLSVWTDALLTTVDRLRALESEIEIDVRRVLAADACYDGLPMPSSLLAQLESVRELAADARDAFGRTIENYSRAERETEKLMRDLGGFLAATIGADVLKILCGLILTNPGLFMIGGLIGWLAIPDTGDGRLATIQRFFMDNPELITSPQFVRWVELLSTSIDDVALGSTNLPGWLSFLPRPPGFDVMFGGALVAAAGAPFGMFRETGVTVERTSTTTIAGGPAGVAARLDRVPEGVQGQVLIEKYEAPGLPPRYIVYVAPTENFTPFADSEPWDSTSNVHGVAGMSPASLRAVELAMADAGITATDEVVLVGFSQGGLIATEAASNGNWNVVGLETHGAPAGHIAVPEGVAGLAVRHTDDLVPALAGPQIDHTLVQIERQAFRDGVEIPDVQAAPAHQRTSYDRTADAIDDAQSQVVRNQVATLDAFTSDYLERDGGTATAMRYQATRTDE